MAPIISRARPLIVPRFLVFFPPCLSLPCARFLALSLGVQLRVHFLVPVPGFFSGSFQNVEKEFSLPECCEQVLGTLTVPPKNSKTLAYCQVQVA